MRNVIPVIRRAVATFCLGVMCVVTAAHAQALQFEDYGKPFIRNYPLVEYQARNQNWAIAQDHRGVMYFGNNSGVLEFNGVTWRLIPSPTKGSIRSLAVDSAGTVFVGTMSEFGYLAPDSLGLMRYVSLAAKLDPRERNFARVYSIHVLPDGIYFGSDEGLFRYRQGAFTIWRPDHAFGSSFVVHGNLYTQESGRGLFKVLGDSLHLVEGAAFFANTAIYVMLPYDGKQALLGTSDGLFLYDEDAHQATKYRANDRLEAFLAEKGLVAGLALPGDRFAFSTGDYGIVVFNKRGETLNWFTAQSGLQDEQVNDLFYKETTGELWAALSDGISMIEVDAPIRSWDQTSGLRGTITDVAVRPSGNGPGTPM